MNMLNIKFN